jgi:hypothetical protein
LVGETKNMKNRLAKHFEFLKNKKANLAFRKDFEEYGSSQFELILFVSAEAAADFGERLDLQRLLQMELKGHGLCYNSTYSETIQPRPTGLLPTESGIYGIRCKENNSIYIGETAQARGISGRCSSHSYNLRNQDGVNGILQADWDLHGEKAFEFLPLESGSQFNDNLFRKTRQDEWIQKFKDEGAFLYNLYDTLRLQAPNCPLSLKNTIQKNQTPEYRQYISRLNTGRISSSRQPVFAQNLTFLSFSEAEEVLKISRRTIRENIKTSKPGYRFATPEEVTVELMRRKKLKIDKLD